MAAKTAQQTDNLQGSAYTRPVAFVFAVLLLLITFGFAWQQLTRSDVLPITELRLSGEFNQQDASSLKELVVSGLNGNFFTVDVAGIHQLVTALPWVGFAWVDRIWPNVLQVRVVEEKPVAYLVGIGLMNRQGEVFIERTDKAQLQGIPNLFGPGEMKKQLLLEYQRFATQLQRFELTIATLNLDERGAWSMKLTNDVEIVLGREAAAMRLERFLRVYGERLNNDKPIKRVDLRYNNGFSISVIGNGSVLIDQQDWIS